MDHEPPFGHNTVPNKPNVLMVSQLRNAVPEACCSFLHSSGHQVHSILPSKHLPSPSYSHCHNRGSRCLLIGLLRIFPPGVSSLYLVWYSSCRPPHCLKKSSLLCILVFVSVRFPLDSLSLSQVENLLSCHLLHQYHLSLLLCSKSLSCALCFSTCLAVQGLLLTCLFPLLAFEYLSNRNLIFTVSLMP